jgi:hypothetical protein
VQTVPGADECGIRIGQTVFNTGEMVMWICPQCARHFKVDSPVCQACGARAVAAIQEDTDPPSGPSTPDFTSRISVTDIRSRLSQKAVVVGFVSGVGLSFLIAAYAIVGYGEVATGCSSILFVAPCAGLIGALVFSLAAESLQILFRPLVHALDPQARKALQKIKRGSGPPATGRNPMREYTKGPSEEGAVTGARALITTPEIDVCPSGQRGTKASRK